MEHATFHLSTHSADMGPMGGMQYTWAGVELKKKHLQAYGR